MGEMTSRNEYHLEKAEVQGIVRIYEMKLGFEDSSNHVKTLQTKECGFPSGDSRASDRFLVVKQSKICTLKSSLATM